MHAPASRLPVRLVSLSAAASIAACFLIFAGPGLRAGFTHDDLMNGYRACHSPLAEHLADVVLFFTFSHSYRPLGTVFYRALFDWFGFNPLPFRIACYALLLANGWLGYCLLRRIGGSRRVASLAVLLLCYHGEFVALYMNTGVVYDILCFFFYAAAFLYYLREGHGVFTWCCLYILCLDSKEMAVSLPVMVGLYEWMWHPPASLRLVALRQWLMREGRVAAIGSVLTILYLAGRQTGPLALAEMGGYRLEISPLVYLRHAFHFLSCALYQPNWLTPGVAIVIAIALVFGAWKSRLLRFSLLWMLIGILPVAFIPQRGLDSVIIPCLGLALYAAVLIDTAARKARTTLVFTTVLVLLMAMHAKYGRVDFAAWYTEGRSIQHVAGEIRAIRPEPRGRILFLRDPFPEWSWATTFLMLLLLRDPATQVYRLDRLAQDPDPGHRLEFDRVFTWDRTQLRECDASPFRDIAASSLAQTRCIIR